MMGPLLLVFGPLWSKYGGPFSHLGLLRLWANCVFQPTSASRARPARLGPTQPVLFRPHLTSARVRAPEVKCSRTDCVGSFSINVALKSEPHDGGRVADKPTNRAPDSPAPPLPGGRRRRHQPPSRPTLVGPSVLGRACHVWRAASPRSAGGPRPAAGSQS